MSPLEVALAWIRDRPGVAAPILGARTAGQLQGALLSEELTLPAEIAGALDDVSAVPVGYPERDGELTGPRGWCPTCRERWRILGRMDYEYAPLRLPSNVDRLTAAAQLAIQAEFSGWELARVQLFRGRHPPGDAPPPVQDRPQPGLSLLSRQRTTAPSTRSG